MQLVRRIVSLTELLPPIAGRFRMRPGTGIETGSPKQSNLDGGLPAVSPTAEAADKRRTPVGGGPGGHGFREGR